MSTQAVPAWVQVGAEVIEVYSGSFGRRRYGATRKIAKVLKTGNFKIEDSDQQYRPWSTYTRAFRTGNGRYGSSSLSLLTDELTAEMAAEAQFLRARKIVESEIKRLENLSRGPDEDMIAAAAQIEARNPIRQPTEGEQT